MPGIKVPTSSSGFKASGQIVVPFPGEGDSRRDRAVAMLAVVVEIAEYLDRVPGFHDVLSFPQRMYAANPGRAVALAMACCELDHAFAKFSRIAKELAEEVGP